MLGTATLRGTACRPMIVASGPRDVQGCALLRYCRKAGRSRVRPIGVERYCTVEDNLGFPSARWDQPRDAPDPVRHDAMEADRAADALRRH